MSETPLYLKFYVTTLKTCILPLTPDSSDNFKVIYHCPFLYDIYCSFCYKNDIDYYIKL